MKTGHATAVVVVVGISLVMLACGGSTGDGPGLLGNDGDDDGGGPSVPVTGTGGFASAPDGGETTAAAESAACPASTVLFPTAVPLVAPDVPQCCSNGFELGDPGLGSTYTLTSIDPAGAPAITLDLDVATYQQADRVVLSATTAAGVTTAIFDSCELKTWTLSDTTGGKTRPVDASIRQFHASVPAGTTSLLFDFGGVTSPMYIRALGLCEFDVVTTTKAQSWRAVATSTDAGLCVATGGDDGGDGDSGNIR